MFIIELTKLASSEGEGLASVEVNSIIASLAGVGEGLGLQSARIAILAVLRDISHSEGARKASA